MAALKVAGWSRSLSVDGILDTGWDLFGEESNGANDPAPPYCEVRWGFLDFVFFFGAGSWIGWSVGDHEARLSWRTFDQKVNSKYTSPAYLLLEDSANHSVGLSRARSAGS